MLTGKAALERPGVNYLNPTVLVEVDPGQSQRHNRRSDFGPVLRESARVGNIRRAQAKARIVRRAGTVPTTGKARERAKRNLRLLAAAPFEACTAVNEDAAADCHHQALPGTGHCRWHVGPEGWVKFLHTKQTVSA